uniref:Uncharacterized protein n=1 Tax=Romanomermis culicivorax TaxID=13658 RepID=A0A915JJP4_ROMCU
MHHFGVQSCPKVHNIEDNTRSKFVIKLVVVLPVLVSSQF